MAERAPYKRVTKVQLFHGVPMVEDCVEAREVKYRIQGDGLAVADEKTPIATA